MKQQDIKISVIVPVYNEVKYLDECISSICRQTYSNLEIILVDDGSSSPCREMCDEYPMKDERIKVIHKENGGSLSARRRGIEEATGQYVSFVDSDDWIELDLYERVAAAILPRMPDMITYSNYYRNYSDGHFMKVYDKTRIGFWMRDEFENEVFPYFIKTDDFFATELPQVMVTYLFKKEFACLTLLKVDDRIKTAEDYVFLMAALLSAESLAAISYGGYHYRSNIKSKSHTMKNITELLCPVYETVNDMIGKCDYDRESLRKKNRLVIYDVLMIKDYKQLKRGESEYLFPYSKITKGTRILIYGAGKLGKQIYDAVREDPNYEVAGLIDKNYEEYVRQGADVLPSEAVSSLDYDYLIIAISYAGVKNQVKRDLIKMGVREEKIAEVDLNVLDEGHLPFGKR